VTRTGGGKRKRKRRKRKRRKPKLSDMLTLKLGSLRSSLPAETVAVEVAMEAMAAAVVAVVETNLGSGRLRR
jgi:hypothetical protein